MRPMFKAALSLTLVLGVSIVSATQITTVIPTNALTGPLVLAAPGGELAAVSVGEVLALLP